MAITKIKVNGIEHYIELDGVKITNSAFTIDKTNIVLGQNTITNNGLRTDGGVLIGTCKSVNDTNIYKVNIGTGVNINSGVTIEPNVLIGSKTIKYSEYDNFNVCIGCDVKIGSEVNIGSKVDIDSDVTLGSNINILPEVNISGEVVIGSKVNIGSGVTIESNLKLDSSTIGNSGTVTYDSQNPYHGLGGFIFKIPENTIYENETVIGTGIKLGNDIAVDPKG